MVVGPKSAQEAPIEYGQWLVLDSRAVDCSGPIAESNREEVGSRVKGRRIGRMAAEVAHTLVVVGVVDHTVVEADRIVVGAAHMAVEPVRTLEGVDHRGVVGEKVDKGLGREQPLAGRVSALKRILGILKGAMEAGT